MAPKTTQPATEKFGDEQELSVEIHNRYLALVEDVAVQPPDQISAQIVARILQQDTLDGILGMAESGALGAREILDRPFTIMERPTWAKGKPQFEDGSGFFVVLSLGMQDTNEVVAVTCGGANVLGQLYAMQTKGMLPNDVPMKFISRPTSRFDVLWLARA